MTRELRACALLPVAWLAACAGPADSGPRPLSVEPADLLRAYSLQQAGVAPDQLPAGEGQKLAGELQRLQVAAEAGTRDIPARARAELVRLESLAHSAADSAGVYAAPTDAELQVQYHAFVATLPTAEFHVAHVLVATESQANALLARLQAGEDFAKLARAESVDDSRSRGGDLGWIAANHLPPEITEAVAGIKVGAYSARPVHTAYGWHLIRLIEVRATMAPPLSEVRAQLVAILQQARYQQFLLGPAAIAGR